MWKLCTAQGWMEISADGRTSTKQYPLCLSARDKKEENAGNQHFLLSQDFFYPFTNMLAAFNWSSAHTLNLNPRTFLWCGK